ncbi:MAG: LacI family transcriptional regulator [Caldilineae bacterium]|nr:MAG: LacI family transcriptional regulator [Caldilineae bacterium]
MQGRYPAPPLPGGPLPAQRTGCPRFETHPCILAELTHTSVGGRILLALTHRLPAMSRRVTIADVAAAAGVSLMTVSRVVNNNGPVSETTRQRVLEVIAELGYRPSELARGLVTRRTRTLGVVVPDVSNPFFAGILRGVEQVAYAQNHNVFLCNTEESPERELTVLQSLEDKHVDGLILCSSRMEDEQLAKVLEGFDAVVLINRFLHGSRVATVLVDDQAGGRHVVEHLLRGGRRRIGFLDGPLSSQSGRLRKAGHRAALADAGLSYEDVPAIDCAPSVSGGLEGARRLLRQHPDIEALVCYNDLVAVGALQACFSLGRKVPSDVAITGFDDIELAALVHPPLTTCRVPRYEIGLRAARLLMQQIHADDEDVEDLVVQPELIVRASAP